MISEFKASFGHQNRNCSTVFLVFSIVFWTSNWVTAHSKKNDYALQELSSEKTGWPQRGCLYESCKVLEQRWNGFEIAQRVSSVREKVMSYESNICLLLVCGLQGPRASTQKGQVLHTLFFVWIKGTDDSRETEIWQSCLFQRKYLEDTTDSHALAESSNFNIL